MEWIRMYQKEALIDPLKRMGHSHQDDESMLAELQHHGAATQLVDFTESLLVALWFACCELNEGEEKEDGEVFVTDLEGLAPWINGRDRKWLSEDRGKLIYDEPDRNLGARIAAQSNMFLVGNPHIPDNGFMNSILVFADDKLAILKHPEQLHISEPTGNFGNVGNWGGVEGYSSLPGFIVIVKSEEH